ncbi:glycoside hydrolase family 6 protein [Demequina sp.]|uniref:glycoside hydrolase family 6 protein n=1 Tax=Demequina sp. TaxID=2050685 RepID=UPI0025B7D1E4|nr:glycoside hydrolase family 6 protein [Demequina sp.]
MSRTVTAAILTALLLAAGCTADAGEDSAPTAPTMLEASTEVPASATPTEPTHPADAAASLTGGLDEFFDAGSSADEAVLRLRDAGRAADADLIQRIADQPVGIWLGEWSPDVTTTVRSITEQASAASQIALFVVYNVPGRDCGLHSAGGAPVDAYLAWVQQVADGVAPGSVAWFVLEPDALAQLGDCEGQGDRVGLLAEAARILDDAGGSVFADVGHSNWHTPETIAERLAAVGTENLAGVATNTSNYNATANERAWGEQLFGLTGLQFITDTSRNGNGAPADGAWCNPRGMAIGQPPQIIDREGAFVATIWTKVPGESDGTCNGGPAAGAWWEEIALELAGGSS